MTRTPDGRRLGATPLADGRCSFVVWAPRPHQVEVVLDPEGSRRVEPLHLADRGYHQAVIDAVDVGTRYRYRLHRGGEDPGVTERPDPASRLQPDGVHGPSAVVDPGHAWTDAAWFGRPLREYVIYELHVGTFTPEGTFDAVIPRLDDLRDLGVTAVELMPLWQFPGERNWGYDGVLPFAVQDSYGGPAGLQRLVDACHARGLCVIIDVVYNHFGPEGNHVDEFAPYLTSRYGTPWGQALNFDGAGSDEVRRFVIENALMWVRDYHADALRLDAVHAIVDHSARHVLAELADRVHDDAERVNRRVHVIAESDLNDPRLVRVPEVGGLGLDAQWSDDFHHALHALVTGERDGYYADYGTVDDLRRAIEERFVYAGRYSDYRGHRHGAPATDVPAQRFVVCAQNHDQVGNRMLGERLTALLPFERLKLVAAVLLLAPYIPLLFMGEEYGEPAPFQYFVSHSDPELVEAVQRGRSEEFAAFTWRGETPDPQSAETFLRSKLDWELRDRGSHGVLLRLYTELLRERRTNPALAALDTTRLQATTRGRALTVHRWTDEGDHALVVANFDEAPVTLTVPLPTGTWRTVIDTAAAEWDGPGAAGPSSLQVEGMAAVKVAGNAALLVTRTTPPA